MEQVDWHAVAARYPLKPGLTYFDNGAAGALPRPMQEVFASALSEWAASPAQALQEHPDFNGEQAANRARLADNLGAAAADIVLTDSTTTALAMVLLGFPFERGDEIVTTQHEHAALYSPLSVLAQKAGVKVVKLPMPAPADAPDEIVRAFQKSLTPRTRALCFAHVHPCTGARLPVQEICRLARSYEVMTLVDGAQAVGMLELNLKDLGCDFYAGAGHKWLNGPPGTGILYLRDARYNAWDLVPILSERAMHVGPNVTIADALQQRAGVNGPALYTLGMTAGMATSIGQAAIEQRVLQLAHIVEQRAADLWGPGCLLSPWGRGGTHSLSSGIKVFVPARDPARARDGAWIQGLVRTLAHDFNIAVHAATIPGPQGGGAPALHALRVSTAIYNFPDQIDLLFTALEQLTTRQG